MTEAEWLRCTDPTPMLRFLQGKTGERKLRLFACACTRLMWDSVPPGIMREAVDVGEAYADGLVPWEKASHFVSELYRLPGAYRRETGQNWFTDHPQAMSALFGAIHCVGHWHGLHKIPDRVGWGEHSKVTGAQQPTLLRDIYGNPLRHVADCGVVRTADVVALAGHIYNDRAYGRVHELADALEDAGCQDADILSHLRSNGLHVRGCWAVDLLLGKE